MSTVSLRTHPLSGIPEGLPHPSSTQSEDDHGLSSKRTSIGFSVLRNGHADDWEEEYERQKDRARKEKVQKDLEGWRGGHGKPRSAYPRQALPPMSYYHQPVTGEIGKHLPKEMVRIERDWSEGEICQFETIFPMELEGRVEPAQLTTFLNNINEKLREAYAVGPTVADNLIAVATLWSSLLWRESHFEKANQANHDVFNPVGLNVLSPREVALQFLEVEYVLYHSQVSKT
nr:hypothetical protein L203_01477 [Cryptococcus depauperatus CBS 7841]